MSNDFLGQPNLDTQCFKYAFEEWNRARIGCVNTATHLPWWKLSTEEKQEVMQLAQRFKREILAATAGRD